MQQPKFADYFVEAAYRPFEFSIHIPRPLPSQDVEPDLRLHQILMHEFQHGLDHVGTPWGFDLSRQIFEAMSVVGDQAAEPDFWRLIRLHDTVRRLNHDRYYRTLGPAAGKTPRKHWAWEFSTGLEFSPTGHVDPSRPVIFTRFFDARSRELIQRQPLSPAALLEARAIFVELQIALGSPDRDDQIKAFIQRAYDPGLAEYSAAAHLTSSILGVDILDAYELASAAAWYGLLLPRYAPERIPKGPWVDTLGEERLRAFATNQDPGFVFATLVQSQTPFEGDANAWLGAAAERCGFPSPAQAVRDAREMIGNSPRLETSWGAVDFETLRQTTLNNFILGQEQFGLFLYRGKIGDLSRLHLADCHYHNGIQSSPQRVLPYVKSADLLAMGEVLQRSITHFLTACR